MDRNSIDWHGVIPPIVTPFRPDGSIDEPAFRRNISFLIEAGVHGLCISGCTGEFWALTNDERLQLFRIAIDETRRRVPVIAGTGAIRTEDVIAMTREAKRLGADGAMVITPFFVTPPPEDIIAHYQAISDAVALPIMLYNIPRHTVNALTPEMVDKLADIDCVVAIKESSADFANLYKTWLLAGDRLRVFLGPVARFGVAAYTMGCSGGLEVIANFWPQGPIAVYDAVRRGDHAGAHRIQAKMHELLELVTANGRNMYSSEKAILNLLGLDGGDPRPPLRPLPERHIEQLREGLTKAGLLGPSGQRLMLAAE